MKNKDLQKVKDNLDKRDNLSDMRSQLERW